ncbi:ATP-binding protein [Streptomyces gamaensis]|uniref:ATP-binding protein n=1 Tax=Streptomyces gamaensis TaxID=1763542 RepID=A0ABW0ZCE4_9ACTN
MSNSAPCLLDSAPETTASPKPAPGNLTYSLGLPAGPYCVPSTRAHVRRLLHEHGLGDLADLATLAASELLANAYLFTPGSDVSLSLRWRFSVLRVTVFDEHPRHPKALRDSCRARRQDGLAMLDAVVGACGGLCGLDEVGAPLSGSKAWVVIPREAAEAYARL